MPIYALLEEHFSRRGVAGPDADRAIAAFANDMVTDAREVFFHAWALRNLTTQFSHDRTGRLSPMALEVVRQIGSDHRSALVKTSRQISVRLREIGASSEATSGPSLAVDQRHGATALLQSASAQIDLVRRLFSVTSLSTRPEADLARLVKVNGQLF